MEEIDIIVSEDKKPRLKEYQKKNIVKLIRIKSLEFCETVYLSKYTVDSIIISFSDSSILFISSIASSRFFSSLIK